VVNHGGHHISSGVAESSGGAPYDARRPHHDSPALRKSSIEAEVAVDAHRRDANEQSWLIGIIFSTAALIGVREELDSSRSSD